MRILSECSRAGDAPGEGPKHTGARPSHAFKESTAIDTVVAMVVLNEPLQNFLLIGPHSAFKVRYLADAEIIPAAKRLFGNQCWQPVNCALRRRKLQEGMPGTTAD